MREKLEEHPQHKDTWTTKAREALEMANKMAAELKATRDSKINGTRKRPLQEFEEGEGPSSKRMRPESQIEEIVKQVLFQSKNRQRSLKGPRRKTRQRKRKKRNITKRTIKKRRNYTLFSTSQQNYRNPTRKCGTNCVTCRHLSSQTFATSTLTETKHPIHLPEANSHCKRPNKKCHIPAYMQPKRLQSPIRVDEQPEN